MLSYHEVLDRMRPHMDEAGAKELALVLADYSQELAGRLSVLDDVAKREDVDRLEEALERLAIAQARTEERVDQLAQAQQRTEERMEELAEAQRRTEERLEQLADTVAELVTKTDRIQVELGGISHAIGYTLEDRAFEALPKLLLDRHGIQVEGRLLRRFVELEDGSEEEVNILGEGAVNGRRLRIVGESKAQLSRRDVNRFMRKVEKLEEALPGERFLVLVTYMTRPEVVEHAESKGVTVFYSYDF